ncbi:MAG: hypothetical protein QM778_23435 [Myxococcales bacterium]
MLRSCLLGLILLAVGGCGDSTPQDGDDLGPDAGGNPPASDAGANPRGDATVDPSGDASLANDGATPAHDAAAQPADGSNAATTPSTYELRVAKSGTGARYGSVSSNITGIDCGPDCSGLYPPDSKVVLSAAIDPVAGTFVGWSGADCAGTGPCEVTIAQAMEVTAEFHLVSYSLTVSRSGLGSGSVSATGIDCGNDCSETFPYGSVVSLTAKPGTYSALKQWSGGGCSGHAACQVTITEATQIHAEFEIPKYTLTVSKSGTGYGSVSGPGGLSCGATCARDYTAGENIVLTAQASTNPASDDSTFIGWSGAGCSGTGTCSVKLSAATTVSAIFALKPNIAFVTSTTQNGKLGGLDGADALCQQRAKEGNLAGTYKAWLSSSTTNAIDRIGNASGWVRPDGRPVASTQQSLVYGKLYYPIRLDEQGVDRGGVGVFTATTMGGENWGNTCTDWTANGSSQVTMGRSDSAGIMFTDFGIGPCSLLQGLICLGVDRAAEVVAPAAQAGMRKAFVTAQHWTPAGGLSAADAFCNEQAAPLEGNFKALLATTTSSAASRFTGSSGWSRADNVPLAATAEEFMSADYWDAPLNLPPEQAYQMGNNGVWSGAATLDAVGTTATTCNNWTSSAGTGSTGMAGSSEVDLARNFPGTSNCNVTYIYLFCLED